MEVIETERLILRPFRSQDRVRIHALVYADPRVAPSWSSKTWTIDEMAESFARKCEQSSNSIDFQAIEQKGTQELIGLIGYQLHDDDSDDYWTFEVEADRMRHDPTYLEVELTYALGYEYQGKGFATESGKALIEYGFQALNIGRIVNSVAEENVDSVALMKRLGMRIVRNMKPRPFGGPWRNSPGVIGILENPHWKQMRT